MTLQRPSQRQQLPDEDSSARRYASRGRGFKYAINALLGGIGVFYIVDVIRNHDRIDPWLSANNLGLLAKVTILALPALLVGFIYYRVWRGNR
jgi:hypothetical protein